MIDIKTHKGMIILRNEINSKLKLKNGVEIE